MNASVFRNTRFEIRAIHQGPNSFGLVCTERGTRGPSTPLEVPEDAFTDSEMRQVHAVLEMLETKYAAIHDAHMADPGRLREELAATTKAIALAKLEHAELEMRLIAKRAESAE